MIVAHVLVSLLACAESRWSWKTPEPPGELGGDGDAQVLEEAGGIWKTL